jgi:hypothetical protein
MNSLEPVDVAEILRSLKPRNHQPKEARRDLRDTAREAEVSELKKQVKTSEED